MQNPLLTVHDLTDEERTKILQEICECENGNQVADILDTYNLDHKILHFYSE